VKSGGMLFLMYMGAEVIAGNLPFGFASNHARFAVYTFFCEKRHGVTFL
jgi:hypothetical protein